MSFHFSDLAGGSHCIKTHPHSTSSCSMEYGKYFLQGFKWSMYRCRCPPKIKPWDGVWFWTVDLLSSSSFLPSLPLSPTPPPFSKWIPEWRGVRVPLEVAAHTAAVPALIRTQWDLCIASAFQDPEPYSHLIHSINIIYSICHFFCFSLLEPVRSQFHLVGWNGPLCPEQVIMVVGATQAVIKVIDPPSLPLRLPTARMSPSLGVVHQVKPGGSITLVWRSKYR